jgi:hypothetical protein
MDRVESKLWKRFTTELPVDPNPLPGVWPFVLDSHHWFQPAVEFHDSWYLAVEQGILKPNAQTKAEGDYRFFRIALQLAEKAGENDVGDIIRYEIVAERVTTLMCLWAAIRSPIGDLAFYT